MCRSVDADAVVGVEPVGTSALATPGQLGPTAFGLGKNAATWPTVQAVHLDGGTFRTLQSLGIADRSNSTSFSPRLGHGLHNGDTDARAGALSVRPVPPDGSLLDDGIGDESNIAVNDSIGGELDSAIQDQLERDTNMTLLRGDDPGVDRLLRASAAAGVVIRPNRYVRGFADSATELAAPTMLIPGFGPVQHPSLPIESRNEQVA